MSDAKHFLASKTVWLNVLAFAALLIPALLNTDLIANNPQLVAWLGMALTVANISLRFFTSQSVSLSGDSTMKVWILLAVCASLLFAADANAFCCCRPRVTKTQVNNADGSVTTIKATVPVFFPLLRGPKVQVTTSQGR